MRRLKDLVPIAVCVALLGGCDGSSTSPIMDPLLFQGQLVKDGAVQHNFVLTSEGLIRIEVVALDEVVAEGAEPANVEWQIGIGIGRPLGEECRTTYTVRALVGQIEVLGLNGAEYCLRVSDIGLLADETVLDYSVMISPDQ